MSKPVSLYDELPDRTLKGTIKDLLPMLIVLLIALFIFVIRWTAPAAPAPGQPVQVIEAPGK